MAADPPEQGFSNSILVCVDCGEEFVFTASAQKYFADRGFVDPPKRCRSCYNEFRKMDHEESESPIPPTGTDGGYNPASGDRV